MTLGHTYFYFGFYVFLSWVQVILHEIEASNDTFDVGKLRRNRASIYSIGLQFYSKFETFCLVKNRAPMEPNRATIWQTLQLRYEFNEAIVLWFTASEYNFSVFENFSIKGKLFFEGEVGNFGERNWLLELEIWREGGRPSELISSYQFHVMNPSFTLVICAIATGS